MNGQVIRGRVYARRNESASGTLAAKTRAVGRMSLRVYRTATGQWEEPVDMGPIEREVK